MNPFDQWRQQYRGGGGFGNRVGHPTNPLQPPMMPQQRYQGQQNPMQRPPIGQYHVGGGFGTGVGQQNPFGRPIISGQLPAWIPPSSIPVDSYKVKTGSSNPYPQGTPGWIAFQSGKPMTTGGWAGQPSPAYSREGYRINY